MAAPPWLSPDKERYCLQLSSQPTVPAEEGQKFQGAVTGYDIRHDNKDSLHQSLSLLQPGAEILAFILSGALWR